MTSIAEYEPKSHRHSHASDDGSRGVTLLDIIAIGLRQRRLVLGTAAGLTVLVASVRAFRPASYTVESSFVVQTQNQMAAAGLAAQLGVAVPGSDPTQSSGFYAALLKTRDILYPLTDTAFATSGHSDPRTLAAIWDISKRTPGLTREAVLDRLNDLVTTDVSQKIDLVTLTVTSRDPLLSSELSEALLRRVNDFNLQTRQSRASEERRFTEEQVAEAKADLTKEEDVMAEFYQHNRQQFMSAALEVEKDRLDRDVTLLNQRYIRLVEEYDKARLDEVRNTPTITIIGRPRIPVRQDARGIVKMSLLAIVLGLLFGLTFAVLREAVKRSREADDKRASEFNEALNAASADLRRLSRAFQASKGTSSGQST